MSMMPNGASAQQRVIVTRSELGVFEWLHSARRTDGAGPVLGPNRVVRNGEHQTPAPRRIESRHRAIGAHSRMRRGGARSSRPPNAIRGPHPHHRTCCRPEPTHYTSLLGERSSTGCSMKKWRHMSDWARSRSATERAWLDQRIHRRGNSSRRGHTLGTYFYVPSAGAEHDRGEMGKRYEETLRASVAFAWRRDLVQDAGAVAPSPPRTSANDPPQGAEEQRTPKADSITASPAATPRRGPPPRCRTTARPSPCRCVSARTRPRPGRGRCACPCD